MKEMLSAGFVGAILGALVVTLFSTTSGNVGGLITNAPVYKSGNASSTNYTIGPDLSTQVLAEKSGRAYASICNDTSTDAYIAFSDTAITATSGASVYLPNNECYEIDTDNLYGDIVQVLGATASSSDLIVTEFID